MRVKFKNEKKISISALLQKLEAIVTKKDGRISFEAFGYEEVKWIYLSLIDFGDIYSSDIKKQLLNRTFRKVAELGKYDKASFLDILNQEVSAHRTKPIKSFYLLSSISVKELPIKSIKIDNCNIKISGNKYPRKFQKARTELFNKQKLVEDKDYLKLIISVESRDLMEAQEEAYQQLEVFRGFICLLINSQLAIPFERIHKPINKVRKGKYSSLHNEDGSCVNDSYYWFEPNHVNKTALALNEDENEYVFKSIKYLVGKFNKCCEKHKEVLTKAINIYVSAFDESNRHICFLKAWTSLETILNTDNNDLLIKRCLAMYDAESKLLEKQNLESLRLYRNELVHEGDNGTDPLIASYMMQNFIYNMIIRFNLKYAGLFDSINESVLFLDNYNPDLRELKMRKKIIDKAIKLKEENTKR